MRVSNQAKLQKDFRFQIRPLNESWRIWLKEDLSKNTERDAEQIIQLDKSTATPAKNRRLSVMLQTKGFTEEAKRRLLV